MYKVEDPIFKWFPHLKVDGPTFAILPPALLLRHRAVSLSDFVIPSLTRIRPPFMYNGELEATMLDPLIVLSDQILKNPDFYVSGCVVSKFNDLARIFGAASQVLSNAGSKPMIDAVGQMLLENQPMYVQFNPKADKAPGDKTSDSYVYLNNALAMTADIAGKYGKVQNGRSLAKLTMKDLEQPLMKLWQYGGMGRGAYLDTQAYIDRATQMSTIEWAIKCLIDPALRPQKKAKTAIPLYEDAYTLAVAYIAYLHWSRDIDTYDSIFPPMSEMPQASAKLAKQQTTAKRVAYHYAALASSAQLSDVALTVRLSLNAISVVDAVLQPETAQLKDVRARFAKVDELIKDFTYAPIADHTAELITKYQQIAGVTSIVPTFLRTMLRLPDYKASSSSVVSVPIGSDGLPTSIPPQMWIDPTTVGTFLNFIDSISSSALVSAQTVANDMSMHFPTATDFATNNLGLPASLLQDPTPSVSANDITYGTPFSLEFLPLSVPQWTYSSDRPREGRFVMKDYQFSVVRLSGLRQALRSSLERFVWPNKVDLAVAASSANMFAVTPIPYSYVKQYHNTHAGDSALEVTAIMRSVATPSWPMSDNFFTDAARMIHSDSFHRESVINALAGLCVVYSASESKDLMPTVPTIYGMPTGAFLEAQDAERPSYTAELPDAGRGRVKYVFKFHSHVPAPGALIPMSYHLESGAIVTVPVLATALLQGASSQAAAQSSTDPLSAEVFNVVDILAGLKYKSLQSLITMQPVEGWSTTMTPYPHLFLVHQPMIDDVANKTALNDFLYQGFHVVNDAKTGVRAVITAVVRDALFLVEPSDKAPEVDSEGMVQPSLTLETRFTINPPKLPKAMVVGGMSEPERPTPSKASDAEVMEMLRDISTTVKNISLPTPPEPPSKPKSDEDPNPKPGSGPIKPVEPPKDNEIVIGDSAHSITQEQYDLLDADTQALYQLGEDGVTWILKIKE